MRFSWIYRLEGGKTRFASIDLQMNIMNRVPNNWKTYKPKHTNSIPSPTSCISGFNKSIPSAPTNTYSHAVTQKSLNNKCIVIDNCEEIRRNWNKKKAEKNTRMQEIKQKLNQLKLKILLDAHIDERTILFLFNKLF